MIGAVVKKPHLINRRGISQSQSAAPIENRQKPSKIQFFISSDDPSDERKVAQILTIGRRMGTDLVLKCRGVRVDQPGQHDDACRNSESLPANRQTAVVRNRACEGRGGPPLGMRGYERHRGDRARPAATPSIADRRGPRCGRAPFPWPLGHAALINP